MGGFSHFVKRGTSMPYGCLGLDGDQASHYRMNIRKQEMLVCPWKMYHFQIKTSLLWLTAHLWNYCAHWKNPIQGMRNFTSNLCHSVSGTLCTLFSKTEVISILWMRQSDRSSFSYKDIELEFAGHKQVRAELETERHQTNTCITSTASGRCLIF